MGPGAQVEDLTATAVLRYRDTLEQRGFKASTIVKQLAAIRQLALALEVQGVGRVKGERVPHGEPRPLSQAQYAKLLKMPDRRTTRGKRDLALLHLLGTAGLRRQEAADVRIDDIEERRRAPDRRLRAAIAGSTAFWVVVRKGKRAHRREIPLDHEAWRRSKRGIARVLSARWTSHWSRCRGGGRSVAGWGSET